MLHMFDIVFFQRGFRPFFLCASAYSILLLGIWVFLYSFGGEFLMLDHAMLQHAPYHMHEMIFGFIIAVMAGFLLTAIPNWTGIKPVAGWKLAFLLLLWLLGRLAFYLDVAWLDTLIAEGGGIWVLRLMALAFYPFFFLSVSLDLIRSKNKRNYIFIFVALMIGVLDAGYLFSQDIRIIYFAVMMIMLVISLIGGRVIPSFTLNSLHTEKENRHIVNKPQIPLDIAAIASIFLVAIALVMDSHSLLLSLLSLVSCALHLIRMKNFHTPKVMDKPILWILHMGYLWMTFGLFMLFLSYFIAIPLETIMHVFTVGSMGSMTLGMMTRVTLGHSQQPIISQDMMIIAFYCMQCATIIRVFPVMLMQEDLWLWVMISSIFWVISHGLFLLSHIKLLLGLHHEF